MNGTRHGLIVDYWPEGSEGLVELDVRASVPPFAGATRSWFNDDELRAFAKAISAYPLPTGACPELGCDVAEGETFHLKVSQVTKLGQLAVTIHLAASNRAPVLGTVSDVHLILLTSYQALHDFACELLAAINAQHGTAHLRIDQFL